VVVAAVAMLALVALPGAAASSSPPALTKERLYELARQRPYGTPVRLDVPGVPMPSVLTDSGVVVGTTRVDDVERPFRWRDGGTELLPSRDAGWASVVDVNERGQVLVLNHFWAGTSRAIVWQPDGTVVPVGAPGEWTSVNGINDHGVVVGVHVVATREAAHLATWQDGVVTELQTPGGRPVAAATTHAINSRGDVAGTVTLPDGRTRGYVWRDDVATELPAPADAWVTVDRITDSGDVVGEVSGAVVLWEDGRRLRDVDRNDRFDLRVADVNAHGVVVGTAGTYLNAPVRSDRRGVAAVLPGLGSEDGVANAVHDLDVVVGASGITSPLPVMWVMTVPVPLGLRVGGEQATGGWAVDVNRRGQVVGWLFTVRPGGVSHSVVIWDLVPRR